MISEVNLYRVIPILLFDGQGLVKTTRFKNPKYVGDILNAIRIFNEKQVDELFVIDISKKAQRYGPDFKMIEEIASECFMPLSYGGGINNLEQCRRIFKSGVEKICLNSSILFKRTFVLDAIKIFGSQAIVASIDVKKRRFFKGWAVRNHITKSYIKESLDDVLDYVKSIHIGEILLTSVDREGKLCGYDTDLIKKVGGTTNIPLVINGGARELDDFSIAFKSGAVGAAAGSMFVFFGKHKAVLITYPDTTRFLKMGDVNV